MNDIELTIYKGEILGLIGRNGAGKSTLINILTGIKKPNSGSFSIFNYEGKNIEQSKKVIGVMPDVDNLYQDLSVKNFIRYMADIKGQKYSLQKIKELLELVGIDPSHESKKIKMLSFGMKKKLCLAQSLIGDPQLLVLDEPTSGLDVHSVQHIKKLIIQLKKDGKSVLLSSHNLEEVERICDRVAILKLGFLTDIDTIDALIYKHKGGKKLSIRSSPLITPELLSKLPLDMNIRILENDNKFIVIEVSNDEEVSTLIKYLVDHHFKIYEATPSELELKDLLLDD